jgi:CTP:molybdopterin cytidylyltransferase MocA
MRLHGAEGAKLIIMRHWKQVATIAVPEAAIDIDSPEDYRRLKDVER